MKSRLAPEALPLLPAAVLVAVTIAWATTGGGYEAQPALDAGYEPDPWYLGALALVGLLCASAFGVGRPHLTRAAKLACVALFGYVVWSFASVLWAHDQGAAFLGSDRALVYCAAFLTFMILPWREAPARIALAGLVAGVSVLAVITAIKLAASSQAAVLFLGARLSYPLGYYNADAVMFMGAATGTIALASRRAGPAILRVAGTAAAAVCLQLAVLSQSRGWLFSAPIVLALTLALVPKRLRLLLFAAGPIAATAAIAPALLDVYGKAVPNGRNLSQPRLGAVLHTQGSHAVKAMLIADLVLLAVAAIAVAIDRRLEVAAATQRRLDRAGRSLAVLLAIAGVGAGLIAVHGHPIERLERAWRSFAHTPSATAGGSNHYTTLASNRADIWRVAWREFARHPAGGIGQDNFAASYTRLRHTGEQPRWTHSLELRLLTHTGIVGTLLFASFLAAALFAALGGPRRCRETAGLLLIPLVVWLVQGSIDWFWEYPALTVPALAFLGAAGALRGRADAGAGLVRDEGGLIRNEGGLARDEGGLVQNEGGLARDEGGPLTRPAGSRRILSGVGVTAAALLAAGALTALVVPFVAARKAREATRVWPSQPTRALAEVRSASNLMPFDAQLYLLGGSISLNLGEYGQARRWLLEAERHDSGNWLTPFALGLVEGEEGRTGSARARLRRAQALNPRERAIAIAIERLHSRHPLGFAEAQSLLAPHIATPKT